jgi:ATP-binding cassette subfamily B protein
MPASQRLATSGSGRQATAGSGPPPSVWSVVGPILRPYRWPLAGGIALNAMHGFAITFQIFTVAWFIDWVLERGQVPPDVWNRLALLAGGYFVVSAVGRMLMWHLGYRIFTWVRERMLTALRAQFFRQVNHLCLRFHMKRSSGELFSYLFGSPLGNVVQFYQHCSMHVAGAITTVGSAVAVLVMTDWVLTLILAVTVGGQVALMERARRVNRRIHLEYQNLESAVTGSVADLLRGTRAVKLYAMEDQVEGEFGEQVRMIADKSYRRDVRAHLEYMKQETWTYAAFAVMLAAITWRFVDGRITLGEATGFVFAFQALSGPLNMLSTAFTLWGSAQASIERIGHVLREASTTPDPEGTEHLVPPAGDLEMRGVHFAYEDKTILQGIDLRIPYGQTVALVGPSGSGKSTIAQLLLRLYDPNRGSVTLGGVDLRKCHGAEIRRRFGVVPQDPFIFRTTIRQNLRVADPDATDAQIQRACRLANAWEFIEKLPGGLDARVGEGGANLSGGQRQRLSIARAILADPPFFLFDEATSALDTLSEQLIQQTMRTVCRGRTAVIIAHRLATVKDCDRIVVVRDGRVAQDGRYDELVAVPGLFRELVEGQQLRG